MSSPDDENKTLGLPPGARNKLLQEIEREKQLAAQRAAGKPAAPASPAGPRPPGPPAPPASRVPGRPSPGEPAPESFSTIPPVGGFPRRRDPQPRDELKPERGPREFHAPLEPWESGLAPQPSPPAREPESPGLQPGWTAAGSLPAEVSSPWDDGGRVDTAPPPPRRPAPNPEPPPRPAREAPPAASNPWGAGALAEPGGRPVTDPDDVPTPAARPAPVLGPGPTVGHRPPSPPPPAPSPPAVAPPRPPASRPFVDDGANRTVAYDRNLHAPHKALLTLQFYNTSLRRWSDLGQVRGDHLELGRSTFQDWNPNPEDLAERHVRLVVEDGRLHVQPLRSLNGVYLKLRPGVPVDVAPHARFRIGRHVLEFRPGIPVGDVEPLRAEDGEVFQSRVIDPLGFIDLIGPDGLPYLSFPLTKPDEPGARIGRGGPRCDLALTGDDWVSSEHARLYFAGGACRLEDLKSTNGTFIQITDAVEIQRGNAARPDSGDVVVIGGYMIRVVEERP